MEVSAINTNNPQAFQLNATAGGSTASAASAANLNSNDFLKLLTVQLSHQDPMNPMEDTEFISQMANFSSLQQMQDLTNHFNVLASSQQQATGAQFLGKDVTIDLGDGNQTSGTVTDVAVGEEGIKVSIGDQSFNSDQIVSMRLPQPLIAEGSKKAGTG